MVNRALKVRVYDQWRRGVSDAYFQARQAAIDCVNGKLAVRPVFGQDLRGGKR